MAGAPTLAERNRPLDEIDELAKQAANGTGRLAVVAAGAGLGKSALLDACAERLSGTMRVLRARGSELERDFAYGIVRQLLTPAVRDPALRDAVLAGAAAHADVLFTGHDPDPALGGEPFEVVHALYWALANLCDHGAVAILVDDVHESDAASLQLLSFVAHRLADLPILLVAAARADEDDGLGDGATRITLDPLSAAAAAGILRDLLDAEPDAAFVAACMQATGGNPFYLHELVRALAARRAAPSADNADWVARLGPASIVRRTLFRLAALPAAVPLARAVAILGDAVPIEAYAELANIDPGEAAAAADALTRSGILAADAMRFVHPIVHAAVLAEFGEHSQRLWHARAADLLDAARYPAEVIGLHLLRTDPAADERRRDILVRAGTAAALEGSPVTAVRLLRRAVAECPSEPSGELSYQLGLAEASLGLTEGLRRMAIGALDTAEPAERVRRALRTTDFQMRSGDLPEAVRLLTAVREGVRHNPDLLLAVDATRYWAGRLHPATSDRARPSTAALRRRSDGADTAARRTLLAYLACESAQEESAAAAAAMFDRALRPPGLLSFIPFDSVAVQATMLSLASIEQHDAFAQLSDAVLDEAGRRGALLAFLVVSTFRAMTQLHRGDLAASAEEAAGALHSAAEQGWERGAAGLAAIRCAALLGLGEQAAASAAIAEAGQMYVPPGFPTALLGYARGQLAAARGDNRTGASQLLECGRVLAGMGIHSPGVLPWRSQAALLLAGSGDVEAARQLAAEELDLARRLAGPVAVGRALHALARTAPRPERIALLEQARSRLSGPPAALVRAMVLVDLGVAHRHERDATAARALLTEGMDAAVSCGWVPLIDRARDELSLLGVVPRSRPVGSAPLTPAELRVARLAAEGRTNTEIAQRLFVTRKTVEKHLGSAYRKLGIRSRDQLGPDLLAAGRQAS